VPGDSAHTNSLALTLHQRNLDGAGTMNQCCISLSLSLYIYIAGSGSRPWVLIDRSVFLTLREVRGHGELGGGGVLLGCCALCEERHMHSTDIVREFYFILSAQEEELFLTNIYCFGNF
jgi:hypothetical protein